MVIAALVVSIVAAVEAAASAWYARRSDRSAARSADAAATTAALDLQRRNAELTPHIRVTCQPWNSGSDKLRLGLFLSGPPELERLDELIVTVRNDNLGRSQARPLAGGPTPEQVAAHIWGPYRFVPATGPDADPARGIPGADPTGRRTPTNGMPVGEELIFCLEPTPPPPWSHQNPEDWRQERGTVLRLKLECRRDGRTPWTLTTEVDTDGNLNTIEVP